MNRPTLMQRINRRLDAHRNGEAGLALLDVLLGMAIFALIAVIAVQAMGQFRERAFVTQATSDAKQLGTGIEAALTEPNATFATVFGGTAPTANDNITAVVKANFGVNLTGTNRAFFISGDRDTYVICIDNGAASKKNIKYSAATGAVAAPTADPCVATP